MQRPSQVRDQSFGAPAFLAPNKSTSRLFPSIVTVFLAGSGRCLRVAAESHEAARLVRSPPRRVLVRRVAPSIAWKLSGVEHPKASSSLKRVSVSLPLVV